jgi:hypothetical protein
MPLEAALVSRETNGIPGLKTPIEPVGISSRQTLYVQRSTSSMTTRVVIVNPSNRTSTVMVRLENLDGTPAGEAQKLVLKPGKMWSSSIDEIEGPEESARPIEGLLSIHGEAGSEIAALSIRQRVARNGTAILSSIPPFKQVISDRKTPMIFPQLVHGGRYTSHFVLFNDSKIGTNMELRFFTAFGTPLQVPIHVAYKAATGF